MVDETKQNPAEEENKTEDTKTGEIGELEIKCDEYLNGWKRERADFLNYKKDEMERISSLVKYANEDIILKIIPILDNFNLAAKHAKNDDESTKGFLLIKKQLEDLLSKEGIETIEVLAKPFDPNTMEIVGETEDKKECVKSDLTHFETVAEEVQKGYTLNGKLIRPAKVKIAK